MRDLLTALAGAVILLLVAALAVPPLIDWPAYRGLVDRAITRSLGVPARSEGRLAAFQRLVVIGGRGGRTAFEVDEVHGLHGYDRGELGPVPATVGRSATTAVSAMLPWNGRAVGCLDAATLLDLIDRSIA